MPWAGCRRKIYRERKLHDDLLDHGETCSPNWGARLTRIAGIKAQIGYMRRPGSYSGKPSLVVDNNLDCQFDLAAPDRVWVTDITYIHTLEGFAYLAAHRSSVSASAAVPATGEESRQEVFD